MRATVPVPPALLRRLWIAPIAGGLSLTMTTIQGMLRDGFDPWHQAVSALSLGPGGWLQMLNLAAFGAVVLTTVGPWRRVLARATGANAYPVLTALLGASFIAVGVIPQDPAPGYDPDALALRAPTPQGLAHLAIAGVAAVSSVAGLLVMAARLARDPAWRGWTVVSALAALGIVGCVTVFGVWSTRPTGFAGSFERGAMVIPMLWMFAFLARLQRAVPLMVPTTEPGVAAPR